MNKMLEKNELPTMWFPENPDSGKQLGATYQLQENTTIDAGTTVETTTTEQTTEIQKTPGQTNRDPRLQSVII